MCTFTFLVRGLYIGGLYVTKFGLEIPSFILERKALMIQTVYFLSTEYRNKFHYYYLASQST